jgi:hypothetical protein
VHAAWNVALWGAAVARVRGRHTRATHGVDAARPLLAVVLVPGTAADCRRTESIAGLSTARMHENSAGSRRCGDYACRARPRSRAERRRALSARGLERWTSERASKPIREREDETVHASSHCADTARAEDAAHFEVQLAARVRQTSLRACQ